jgi:hypothetical protein
MFKQEIRRDGCLLQGCAKGVTKKGNSVCAYESIETELPVCFLAIADAAIRQDRCCAYGVLLSTNSSVGVVVLTVRLAFDHVP